MKQNSLLLGIILAGTITGSMMALTLRAALVVNTNFQAINAQNKLNQTVQALSETFERISSGLRMNNAADDGAGLGVSENLDADVRALKQGTRNAHDAISVIQTAAGSTNEVANIIQRMRELAVQSSSDTLGIDERTYVDDEFEQLNTEVERITQTTTSGNSALAIADDRTVASPNITVTTDLLQSRLQEIGAMLHTALQLLKEPPPQNTKKKFFTMQSPALQQISAAEKLMGKTQKEVVKSMGEFQKKLQQESDRLAAAVAAFERVQRTSRSASSAASASSTTGTTQKSKKGKGSLFNMPRKKK